MKYNSTLRTQPLWIEITFAEMPGEVMEQVRNPIRLRQQPFESTGIGLRNLYEQYRLLGHPLLPTWGAQGDVFQVRLPLIEPATAHPYVNYDAVSDVSSRIPAHG